MLCKLSLLALLATSKFSLAAVAHVQGHIEALETDNGQTASKRLEIFGRQNSPSSIQSNTFKVNYPKGALHKDQGNKLLAKVNNDGPKRWLKTFTNFFTRFYRTEIGAQAAHWLFDQVKQVSSQNPAITVQLFKHEYIIQPSIIAQLPGSSPSLVVVGAHLDSRGESFFGRGPGADDNGASTVAILEALRVLAESGFGPKNTIEFHWYAAEEGGLIGSKEIWASYNSSGKDVIAFLNQELAGYSPSGVPALYTSNTSVPLTNYVRALVTDYMNITPNSSTCLQEHCSDHESATEFSFPAALIAGDVYENENPNMHSENDTYENIMWPTVLLHAKIVTSYLLEASYI